jgi:hypothetical protein
MKTFLRLALLSLLLSGCNFPLAGLPHPVLFGLTGPQAWIDAPLDNMHIPLAPYEVVFHASDNSGVTSVELSINAQPVSLPALAQAGDKLVTVKYAWVPPQPGEYLLQARSGNGTGDWSGYSTARVWVGEITPTAVITITPTPTTITPTITPTLPAVSASFGQPVFSSNVFEYAYDCFTDPEQVTFTVNYTSAGQGVVVYFFYRLNNLSNGNQTEWNDGLNTVNLGGGSYQITFSSKSIPNVLSVLKGASAEFLYQFVASDPRSSTPVRSAVYSNIKLIPSCHGGG